MWFIVAGAFAGWLAGRFIRDSGFGFVGNVIAGVVGAVIGALLFHVAGVRFAGNTGGLIVAFVSGVVFLFLIHKLKTLRRNRWWRGASNQR